MPNWCNNNIVIAGPVDTIRQLWEDAQTAAEGQFGLLQAMAPMPAALTETTAPSESGEDWYSWRVNNWGTKWDVSDEGLEFIDNGDGTAMITGWFDSAWSPPIGAYESFLDDMDNCSLTASYFEPGMDFAGFWDNGLDQYCEDLHGEYHKPEDDRSDLYKRLDEEYDLSYQFAEWDDISEEYED